MGANDRACGPIPDHGRKRPPEFRERAGPLAEKRAKDLLGTPPGVRIGARERISVDEAAVEKDCVGGAEEDLWRNFSLWYEGGQGAPRSLCERQERMRPQSRSCRDPRRAVTDKPGVRARRASEPCYIAVSQLRDVSSASRSSRRSATSC